jgi:hypothetical protein
MRSRMVFILIVVLLILLARNSGIFRTAEPQLSSSDQKALDLILKDGNFEKSDSVSPMKPELAVELFRKYKEKASREALKISDFKNDFNDWIAQASEKSRSLNDKDTDYIKFQNETYTLPENHIQAYSIQLKHEQVFLIRDKRNDSILFIGKLVSLEDF